MKRPFVLFLIVLLVGGGLYARRGCSAQRAAVAPDAPAPVAPSAGAVLKAQREILELPLEREADPVGELPLSGFVVDDTGAPVPEAAVTIDTVPERQVASASDGGFEVLGLAPRNYVLTAQRGALVSLPTTVQLGESTAPVTLQLRRVAGLEISVVDGERNLPIAGAQVEVRGAGLRRSGTTAADGSVALLGVAPGSYTLFAAAAGYAPTYLRHAVMDALGGSSRVTMALLPGVSAAGRVVDAGGKPVAGAQVAAESASELVSLVDPARDGVVTDERGQWRIAALTPGSYRFVARKAGQAPGGTPPTQVDARGARDITITLPAAARLAGLVTDTSGAPVPFATVRAVVDEGAWGHAVARQVTCSASGEFELAGLPRKLVNVVALGGAASSLTRTFDLAAAPQQGEVVLVLDAGGEIFGSVVDEGGSAIARAQVWAEPSAPSARTRIEGTLRGALSAVAGEDGSFAFYGLPTGRYSLRASWPGTAAKARTVALRPPVVAETGARDVRLVLVADGGVRGTVQRNDGVAPAMFTVALGGGAAFGGGSGEFAITGVPAGKHTLRISGLDFATRTIDGLEVKPGQLLDLGRITVVRGRQLTGKVVRADGSPVAGATVTVTKKVTGVVAGPAGAVLSDLKQVTSRADGTFALVGLGNGALAVGAEHLEGRSGFMLLSAGTDDLSFELTLQPAGTLRGLVTRGGEPASGAVVVANAKGAPSGGASVTTGSDGRYQFGALTPGLYTVVVMYDNGSGSQMKQAQVKVQVGDPTQHDLDLPRGQVTLVVSAKAAGGGADSARVFLTEVGAGSGGADGRSATITRTAPARFTELRPGSYQLCVARADGTGAAPGAPGAPACTFVGVTESPKEQQAAVSLPAS